MTDLEFIKKHYGEKFAHFCRDNFPTILEQPGLLSKIIFDNFAPTHSLYEDITTVESNDLYNIDNYTLEQNFIELINNCFSPHKKEIVKTDKTPFELLDKAGYILCPECKCEKDIQSFKKYYKSGEELCTFKGGRLNECRVWFAIKKDVNNIKREDFSSPSRQDKYGTSVISIQIAKNGILSIKNRYNHTIKNENPDATFSNNLDNIIPGLTYAFENYFNLPEIITSQAFESPKYILAADGKYYRWNIESDNIYYCENNVIIINGTPKKLDQSRYLLMDRFILDKQKKCFKMISYDNEPDSFMLTIPNISKIDVNNSQNKGKMVVISPIKGKKIYLGINSHNEITQYINENVVKIPQNFMLRNTALNCISIPNARIIEQGFLDNNEELTSIYLPHVKYIGEGFCACNEKITDFIAPEVIVIELDFLPFDRKIKRIVTPKLNQIDATNSWNGNKSKAVEIIEKNCNTHAIHL